MSKTTAPQTFLPLHQAANRLGVPAAWLRNEADAGRVPCLRAGRRVLFNPDTIEAVLLERAQLKGDDCDE